MFCKIEIIGVNFHARIKPLSKEEIDEALLGSGYSAAFHDVPNLYPRPRLPEELIAIPGVLAPHKSVELSVSVGHFKFSIVNENTIEYVLTHLDGQYRYRENARFKHLETSDGRRLYTWGQPQEQPAQSSDS